MTVTAFILKKSVWEIVLFWFGFYFTSIWQQFVLSDFILFCSSHSNQRRRWHPTPVLLPGKSHGWRSLVGCSPWGHKEWDTTERLHFHFSLSCTGEGNGNPLQCSCLENPRDGGAWWVSVYGAAQSRTQLKRLSSSRSSHSNRRKISLPWWLSGKDLSANAGDMGSVSGLGRSNGERNGNPLQYSCLENSVCRGALWATDHGVAKSWTWLSDLNKKIFSIS